MKCRAWGCDDEADWRSPDLIYGACRRHATNREFWPVSQWALDLIHNTPPRPDEVRLPDPPKDSRASVGRLGSSGLIKVIPPSLEGGAW